MKNSLSSYFGGRDNNFNLIRFFAATAVLVSHCFPLFFGDSELEPLKRIVGISLGSVAVDIFFISSGFLIANSLFYRRDIPNFIKARFLRIYPGLIVSLLLTVLLLGSYFTTLSLASYFTSSDTLKFFFFNTILFFGEEANLPGVFASLPWPNTVNGSLWTLPFEVRAYTLLVLFSLLFSCMARVSKVFLSRGMYLVIAALGMGLYFVDYFHEVLPISYFGTEYARLITMFLWASYTICIKTASLFIALYFFV